MKGIGKYWKAIAGFVAPGAVALGAALTAGSDGGTSITTTEWISAGIACVVTSAAVYRVQNKPNPYGAD